MADLPSYEEATTRQDWLELVAPYVSFRDYCSLSLVNSRFWHIFAPRLWENPLRTVRLAGLDPNVSWWFDFVFNELNTVRPAARSLVRVLDATRFAKESYHFASDRLDRNMQLSFAKALELCPNTLCIVLDGHTDLDPGFLVGPNSETNQHSPILLSVADCPYQLPGNFFTSNTMRSLVYLDLSAVPGSVRSILRHDILPDLSILKLRNRELDDEYFGSLSSVYGQRLWSLDVSHNRLTDDVVDILRDKWFPKTSLRTPGFFYIEGKLTRLQGGTNGFGPFCQIQESQWSKVFNHPERFFIDSPIYLSNEESRSQEYQVFRASGKEPLRKDTADDIVNSGAIESSDTHGAPGLTHLDLSDNLVSAAGLQRLVRTTNGQMEHLACDFMPLLPLKMTRDIWPFSAQLCGIVGAADLFRPVMSSNLRSLRIHHSLVTGILDLRWSSFSGLSRTYLAEKVILPRIQRLYGGVFTPDMNPRLTSLILTHVPRRSSGPLTDRLKDFLILLSQQESVIQAVAGSSTSSRRTPDLLLGLRRLRLEFEPDPLEDGFSTAEDLDAEDLMSSGDQGFSFFEGEQYEKSPAKVRHGQSLRRAEHAATKTHDATPDASDGAERETSLTYHGEWEGKPFSVEVWLGPSHPPIGSALEQYRRLVEVHKVRDGVGPVSPAQIRAGAPEGSYIFHTAWDLAIMPLEIEAPPKSELEAMEDVLEALKRYRLETRAKYAAAVSASGPEKPRLGYPHYFWTGKLEVSTEQSLPQGRVSQYWR
ncbi:leucine rich repeat domain containing protein [Sarocladium implicatum]|nr:leucine rich repeat domain containing protein [Sarocladium implicatum]